MDSIGEDGAMGQMLICVDARLRGGEGTGVAYYAEAVAAALAANGRSAVRLVDDTAGRFGMASGPAERTWRWIAARRASARSLRYRGRTGTADLYRRDVFRLAHVRFGQTGKLLRLRVPGPVGVMHWTYPIPALIEGWINIHTVHDAIPMLRPDLSQIDGAAIRARIAAVAACTDRIVTVSDYARTTILDATGIDPAMVVDCSSAVVALERSSSSLPAGLEAGRYLLFVGLFEARKNLAAIARAWRASGTALPLVLVGPDGCDGSALRGELAALGCRVLPFQPRGDLVGLIAQARALILPSIEEGFGLPAAEAMTLGTPVVTSARGALAEIAGDAALLVDPADLEALAWAIGRIATDDGLAVRLRTSGLERAQRFTPERFGARLLGLYDKLIAARGMRP